MGADVSGHVGAPRHATHIGFVLGAEDYINRAHKRLGAQHVHMTKLSDAKRNKISHFNSTAKRRRCVPMWKINSR